jgi:hypothetical protein
MIRHDKKSKKKKAKAQTKAVKAEAKAKAKAAEAEAKARIAEAESTAASRLPGLSRLPRGVEVTINEKEGKSELVVSGLTDEQLKRLLPHIGKDVVITVAEDQNALRAGMMRFVREGVFQTIIKVIAGLIVGYLLLTFGLK